ncbi:hypothetical protein [Rhizobium gallicum]|uniref:hypothetical protein n=1 Tax=Rhizobium gallicum TaxID=56730 RepID=UPI000587A4A5|nr:hypothetical protein [Rhizobium gallicum]
MRRSWHRFFEGEILYRLLSGPQAGLLEQIANGESRLNQIGRAIEFVRKSGCRRRGAAWSSKA